MPVTTHPPTTLELVDALRVAGGELDHDQRLAALTTYRLLTAGAPVTNADIAEATGIREDVIASYFEEWEGVFRDQDYAIVGFWGLAIAPLDPEYKLIDHDTGEPVGYAWCAWDTLFLPTVLGRVLDITSTDGHTGKEITLTVGPDGSRVVKPEKTLVSFLSPTEPWEADILATFCHKVLFFGSTDSADAWMSAHPDELFTLSVDDAFQVGSRWTADRYGDALTS